MHHHQQSDDWVEVATTQFDTERRNIITATVETRALRVAKIIPRHCIFHSSSWWWPPGLTLVWCNDTLAPLYHHYYYSHSSITALQLQQPHGDNIEDPHPPTVCGISQIPANEQDSLPGQIDWKWEGPGSYAFSPQKVNHGLSISIYGLSDEMRRDWNH